MNIDSILSITRQWGFSGVELRAANGHTQIVRALKERYSAPAKMATAITNTVPCIASLDSSLQLLSPTDEHKAEVLDLAHWADALGVPYIRVFDGQLNNGQGEDAGIMEILATLDWWQHGKRTHHFQCDLMIETHWFLTNPHLNLSLAAQSPYPLHLLWDSFHTWKASALPVSAVWELLRPYVRHVHFKDGKTATSRLSGTEYCLPGDGDFPLGELFDVLSKDRFSGWVSLEWEHLWHPYLPPLEEALAAGRRLNWW